jgi:hypothetical protein
MAKTIIGNASLTKQQLLSIFEEGFFGRYDVYESRLPAIDLIIKKSGMVGVFVRMKHTAEGPQLTYARVVPSTGLRVLVGNGLMQYLLLGFLYRPLEKEVGEFIASSAALQGEGEATIGPRASSAAQPQDPVAKHGLVAGWMAATVLLAPTLIASWFGEHGLWITAWTLMMAALAAGVAFGASKTLGGARGALRGGVIAMLTFACVNLLGSLFSWGPLDEVYSWFFPERMPELLLYAISGGILGVVHGTGTAPARADVAAEAV